MYGEMRNMHKNVGGFAGKNKMDLEGIVLDCEYDCTGSG
jgi:hypothetical protein